MGYGLYPPVPLNFPMPQRPLRRSKKTTSRLPGESPGSRDRMLPARPYSSCQNIENGSAPGPPCPANVTPRTLGARHARLVPAVLGCPGQLKASHCSVLCPPYFSGTPEASRLNVFALHRIMMPSMTPQRPTSPKVTGNVKRKTATCNQPQPLSPK